LPERAGGDRGEGMAGKRVSCVSACACVCG